MAPFLLLVVQQADAEALLLHRRLLKQRLALTQHHLQQLLKVLAS